MADRGVGFAAEKSKDERSATLRRC